MGMDSGEGTEKASGADFMGSQRPGKLLVGGGGLGDLRMWWNVI